MVEEGKGFFVRTGPENTEKLQRLWRIPNFYGRSRSQFLTPGSENWRVKIATYSGTKPARRRSSYKNMMEELNFHPNRSRKYEKKCQQSPNYYGRSQTPILDPKKLELSQYN